MSTQVTLYGGQFDSQVIDWPVGAQTISQVGEAGTRWTYAIAADPTKAVLTGVDSAPPAPVLFQQAQLAARTEFRARQLEKGGQLLQAYALRNNLTI